MDEIITKLDKQKISQYLSPYSPDENRTNYTFAELLGDHSLNPQMQMPKSETEFQKAAVLVPILNKSEPTILFTLRASHLKKHSGQIAFPGGRREKNETALEAALRESFEEIGLPSTLVSPAGYLDYYLSGTCYMIIPVVGIIDSAFHPEPNPDEVAQTFEVPLYYFQDISRFEKHTRIFQGKKRSFYAISYQSYYIWGVTAGILYNFCQRMTSS